MHLDLKFCGITREEDLKFCFDHQVPYVGLNFYRGSKRFLQNYHAVSLLRSIDSDKLALKTTIVAVVVDMKLEELDQLIAQLPLIKTVQFHGQETLGFLKAFSMTHPQIRIWKAIPIKGASDFEICSELEEVVDMFLFDTHVQQVDRSNEVELGGTGQKFDWDLLRYYKSPMPFALAGGIKVEMIDSVAKTKAMIADVCSGIEVEPGVKSEDMMQEFIQKTRKTIG